MSEQETNDFSEGDLTGVLLADRFQLGRLLGAGASGEVYLAEHVVLGVPYAVKILRETLADDPVMVGRFRREAFAASRLDHPHIVHTIDFGRTEDEQLYLVMEYVEGPSLRSEIESAAPGTLPLGRGLRILAQVARALAHAHGASIIHRDLKPENILLGRARDGGDHAKILDFGLAKVLSESEESPLTQLGQVFGSPRYMSPEQARGQPVERLSDVYSFGALAYDVVCGRPPFVYDSLPQLLIAHMEEKPPLPSALLPIEAPPLPEGLEELLLACVDKLPPNRPASMEEVANRLDALLMAKPAPPKRALPEDVALLVPPSLKEAAAVKDAVAAPGADGSTLPAVGRRGPSPWDQNTDRGPTLKATDLQMSDLGGFSDPAERAWFWGQVVKQAITLAEQLNVDGMASEELAQLVHQISLAEDASVAAEAETALADSALADLDAEYAQIERDIRFALVDLSMTLSSLQEEPGLGLAGEDEAAPSGGQGAASRPGTVTDFKAQIAALDRNLGERHQEKAKRQQALEKERDDRHEDLNRAQRAQAEVESRFVRALLLARPVPTSWTYRQSFDSLSESLRRLRVIK